MLKVGIIGNGSIVKTWMEGVLESGAFQLHSAYLRSENKKGFFQDFGIEKIYYELEEFLKEEDNDIIYIALPNSLHYEYALKAIRAGRHVILEKPFTSSLREAEHLFKEACAHDVYIFEGICNIYNPNFLKMKASITEPSVVYSSFHQLSSRYQALLSGGTPNIFNLDFSGGVLMDLMVYQLHACYALFGKPNNLSYFPKKFKNGIDLSGTIVMEYDTFNATLLASKEAESEDQFVCINADQKISTGTISLMEGFFLAGEWKEYNRYENYLAYEIETFSNIIENNNKERYEEAKDATLAVMELLDRCRSSGNIIFKNDNRELL